MYSADAEMKTGMGVVRDVETMTAGLPTAEAGVGVSLVDKERIPTGRDAGRNDLSDYHDEFVNVAAGEMVNLYNFVNMLSVFGTDQYNDAGLQSGDRVAVGTDGKWKKATVASLYVFDKKYDDAGHELLQISVADTAEKNA